MQTKIYSLSFGGEGVGKIEGKVCFVDGALPEEVVEFDVLKNTQNYIKGKAVKILKSSAFRIKPQCPHFGICGGCQLQHLDYSQEVSYKQAQVNELLARIGSIKNYMQEPIIASDRDYGYRTSITLHKGNNGYGFYAKDNKTIIKIDNCPIADNIINNALKRFKPFKLKDDITIKSDSCGRAWTEYTPGERFYCDEYLGEKMVYSPKIFTQANRFIAGKMAEYLKAATEDNENTFLYDAYCGAGFFSIILRHNFQHVIGIEADKQAVACADSAKKEYNYANLKFYHADVELDFFDIFDRYKNAKNILLLDPPRQGISKEFLNKLKTMQQIQKIYYISCDPAILSRDLKCLLQDSKFSLDKVQTFDMFPRTKHIETIAKLINKG